MVERARIALARANQRERLISDLFAGLAQQANDPARTKYQCNQSEYSSSAGIGKCYDNPGGIAKGESNRRIVMLPDDKVEQIREAERNLTKKEGAHEEVIQALNDVSEKIRREIANTVQALEETEKP